MKRSETVTITNMCMVYDGNKVLVENRIKDDWRGIAFPGGHVEKGEPFTDAVIREVFEETGLKISSPKLCGIEDWTEDDGSRYMVLLYKTDKFEGEPVSSAEGEVYWTEFDNLGKMPLAVGMEKMLRVFNEEDISEFFYHKENGEWIGILK